MSEGEHQAEEEPERGETRDRGGPRPRPRTRAGRQRLALVVTPIVGLIVAGLHRRCPHHDVGRQPSAAARAAQRPQPDPGADHQPARRRLVLPRRRSATAGLRPALLPARPVVRRRHGRLGREAVEDLRGADPASTSGPSPRRPTRSSSSPPTPTSACSPGRRACGSGLLHASTSPARSLRLYFIRRVGEAFDEPIQAVLRFFADYRLPLFIFSVALVVFILWSDRRQGEGRDRLDAGPGRAAARRLARRTRPGAPQTLAGQERTGGRAAAASAPSPGRGRRGPGPTWSVAAHASAAPAPGRRGRRPRR